MLAPAPTISTHETIQRLTMSYEEYLAFAPDSQKVEWVNGEAIIYMPATPSHQNMVVFLASLLRMFTQLFNLGTTHLAPVEVKLSL